MRFYNKQKGVSVIFIVGVISIILLIVGGVFIFKKSDVKTPSNTKGKDILIGFSITTLQEERWQKDKSEFIKKAEELGAVVDLHTAQNEEKKQIDQIESMIIKGVDAIVVVPLNANSLSDVLNRAHDAGIKIISYDRMVNNADIDVYVSFDSEKVGEYQAQYVVDSLKDKLIKGSKLKFAYVGGSEVDNNSLLLKKGSFKVLKPFIDNGSIEIVFDKFTSKWNPDVAYSNLKEYLQKNGGKIDAVIAANDGTAFGSITALSLFGLSGKVPVSGQDAELAAAKRIIEGTQTMTVYKPISKLASTAAEIAVSLVNGEMIKTNSVVNNGKIDVPSVLLDPIPVTRSNIDDTLIKDGYHKREDIYKQ